ncbi:MAG: ThiF family adenylyltransferase [Thermoanaerobaculia bacterium]
MQWLHRSERIAWELEQLLAGGFDFEEPTITDEVVTLAVFVGIEGERHRLEVDFFELFPYFRFEVRAPTLSLDHHQHPFGKNLCLIPRGTRHWEVARSVAAALREQLPKVLATGRTAPDGNALQDEDRQAEPVTTYFPSAPDSAVFFDGGWKLPPDFTIGRLTLTRDPGSRQSPFRGVVAEVLTRQNEALFTAPPHLSRAGDRVEGYVVRLASPILEPDASVLFARVRREYLHGLREPSKLFVVAVVVPEEDGWRMTGGQGWLFIVIERGCEPYFARPARAGVEDLYARAPELAGLRNETIAHFGLGCIGAPSAVEFAKAGIGALRILDHDVVETGTALRWPLGLPVVGGRKTEIISNFLKSHYPLTRVSSYVARLGSTRGERRALEGMLDGASLVYDAIAEPGASYFLADLARHHGIPYVGVSGTPGGWGGNVARLRPDGGTGCWYCLERAKDEGLVPAAPADPVGMIQPAGCEDPTFTGAGFDLLMIALAGVRTAVATLVEGAQGYPASPSDITVIAFRDAKGGLIQPQFIGFDLHPYPDCPACGSGSR